ncbi:hypothetical protein ACNPQM_13535 [Streptomyces sp. NPDC056231]|uniref:hypothetical protein n=1 Tax=Streptomyces sp. NPDC056231 TaxID=3345755 RepID=UPI003AAA29EA
MSLRPASSRSTSDQRRGTTRLAAHGGRPAGVDELDHDVVIDVALQLLVERERGTVLI